MELETVSAEHGTDSQRYVSNMIDANDAITKFNRVNSEFNKVADGESAVIQSLSKSILELPELRNDSREELLNSLVDLKSPRFYCFVMPEINLHIFCAMRLMDSLDRAARTAYSLAEEHYSSLTRNASRMTTLVTQPTTIMDHEDDSSWKAAAGIEYQLRRLGNWAITKEQLNKYIAEMKLHADRLAQCIADNQRLQESAGGRFDQDASIIAVRNRLHIEMLLAH